MITKVVIKDYVLKRCPYLVSLELNERTLLNLLKNSIENKQKYRELVKEENLNNHNTDEPNDEFDLYETIKEYPSLIKEIIKFQNDFEKNEVESLIEKYNDQQLISKLSRLYFENKYGKENCKSCDIDENGNAIYDQELIEKITLEHINNPNVKVIFEGQIEKDNLRARFDVLIREDKNKFTLIEVKGTNDVFAHPKNRNDIDSKIKVKYLYDLLFQYHVYKDEIKINEVGFMFTDKNFKLSSSEFPISSSDLEKLFIIKKNINLTIGTKTLKEYFDDKLYMFDFKGKKPELENDSIEEIIEKINKISNYTSICPKKDYLCRKGPICPFIDMCFKDAFDPNSIFMLTNWNLYGGHYTKTMKLINEGIYNISDIQLIDFNEKSNEKRYNVYTQIRYQKGEIKEKYVIDLEKVKELLIKDYINKDVKWLIFFDFESFQHCLPLVYNSTPWKQVVSQYSMHIVRYDYDLKEHDYENGTGGNITHKYFIGNPDKDKYENPSLALFTTLKSQLESLGIEPLGSDYKVVVFNKNFEKTRMNEFILDRISSDNSLNQFVHNFNNNVIDLLDFFTSGAMYCKDFNGKGSLKVIQPTLTEDKDVLRFYENNLKFDFKESLNYHKEGLLVYNGSICLDLYKSLLIRSHLNEENESIKTVDLLKSALEYCKIDSWGTVIIFDVIKNIYEGNLKLDCLFVND